MRKGIAIAGAAAVLAASVGGATAGGLDRSGQSVGILFASGNQVELSFGGVTPNVSGTGPLGNPTGNVAQSYVLPSLAVKRDFANGFSVALIYDRPFGADISYGAGSAYAGTQATLQSDALTALVSYGIGDRFQIHGGVSAQRISASASVPAAGSYTIDAQSGSGLGYVAGAAYQIPEIALRVALTYRSEVTSRHTITEGFGPVSIPGSMDLTTPQSVNLDFQTGINPKTLIFGSVRWVDWSVFSIAPPAYVGATTQPLVSYTDDVITYSLGVGRKINDNLSLAATVGYERSTGNLATALGPTDGMVSLGLGVSYATDNGAKVTAGMRKVWLGDADIATGGTFTGNSAVAVGVKYTFEF